MEKHNVYANCEPQNKIKSSVLPTQQLPKNVNKLGGVFLYNQDFKRHLNIRSHDRKNMNGQFDGTGDDLLKSEQQQLMMEKEISDFLQKREGDKVTVSTLFTSQIENIIHKFKTSHLTTNRFLQQHQNNNQQANQSIFSFEDLLESERIKNREKYNRLMEKIKLEFRHIVIKEVSKIKNEDNIKSLNSLLIKKQSSTQTSYDIEGQLFVLRKEIERKEAEYKALYQYKKDMINQGENAIKSYQIRCQFQKNLIYKLENEVAAKNLQIKTLQNQLKQSQDKLFSKMLQVQKLLTITRSKSISSIQQIINPNQLIKQNEVISNFLSKLNSKKKRYKQRAQSILSITHSLFSNIKDKDDLMASMADIASKSLREIDVNFDRQIDDQFIEELLKASQHSAHAQNLFKILQIYRNNKKNRSSIEKLNKKLKGKIASVPKNSQRNSMQSGSKIDNQFKRGSIRLDDPVRPRNSSKDSKQKKQLIVPLQKREQPKSQKKVSKHSLAAKQNKQNSKSKFVNRKISFQRPSENVQHQIVTQPVIKDQKTSKVNHKTKEMQTTENKNEDVVITVNQNTQSKKKLKKGVSFQVENQKTPFFTINSQEVNILINNNIEIKEQRKRKEQKEQGFQIPLHKEKSKENYIENFDKHRLTKHKLVKSRVKDQIHKKTNSMLDSEALAAFTFSSPTNDKSITPSHALSNTLYGKSSNQRQQERYSCHNSQQRIVNMPKRNSYSRLQRPTFNTSTISSPNENERQTKIAKQLALKSKSKAQYHDRILQLHKGCVQNCEHIKKYLQFYDKCRQYNKKQNMKLKIENLNNNIRESFPTLSKALS